MKVDAHSDNSSRQHLEKWQTYLLMALLAGYMGYFACRTSVNTASPAILAQTNLTKSDLGMMLSYGYATYAGGKIINGILIDRFGGRPCFLFGLVMSVILTAAFTLAGSGSGGAGGRADAITLTTMTLTWAADRYFQSLGWGSLIKIVSAWWPPERHGGILGIASLSYGLGDTVLRLALGGMLAAQWTWQAVVMAAVTVAGILLLPCWLWLRSSPKDVGLEEPKDSVRSVYTKVTAHVKRTVSQVKKNFTEGTASPKSSNSKPKTSQRNLTGDQEQRNPTSAIPSVTASSSTAIRGLDSTSPSLNEVDISGSNNVNAVITSTRLYPETTRPTKLDADILQAVPLSSQLQNGASPYRSQDSTTSSNHADILSLLLPLFQSRKFWLLVALSPCLTTIRETFNSWVTVYMSEVLGASAGQAAVWSVVFPLAGTVSTVVGGYLADRVSPRRRGLIPTIALLSLTAVLCQLAYLTELYTSSNNSMSSSVISAGANVSTAGALLAVTLVGAVALCLMCPFSFLEGLFAMELGGKQGPALTVGIINAVGYAGAVMAGHMAGYVAEEYGWSTLVYLQASLSTIGLFLILLHWREDVKDLKN